jgi:(E)-4-hydroxy-3-methylbut-2-enyl-diphosphate synthase
MSFRRQTTEVAIGPVVIGGANPVAVQSMCDVDTNDIEACVAQIGRLRDAGCRIVRLTTQGMREAESMREIARRVREVWPDVALVADVHFQPAVALALAGVVDKVRINPGNYERSEYSPTETRESSRSGGAEEADGDNYEARSIEYSSTERRLSSKTAEVSREGDNYEKLPKFAELVDKCRSTGTAIRIGVNYGSLATRIVEEFGDTPAGMVASAMEFLRVCRSRGFDSVVVSMKASNTRVMVAAYRELVRAMDAEDMQYPLHLGVTEAGSGLEGRVKSAVGIGALLTDGIGDTIRVSLTEPPENEIPVARAILQACGLDRSRTEFIACPGCGRTLYALSPVLEEIKAAVGHIPGLKIAVMGCIVNGPGEMADADYGYVGSGPGRVTLYRGREVVRRDVQQQDALDALIELLKADNAWVEKSR